MTSREVVFDVEGCSNEASLDILDLVTGGIRGENVEFAFDINHGIMKIEPFLSFGGVAERKFYSFSTDFHDVIYHRSKSINSRNGCILAATVVGASGHGG